MPSKSELIAVVSVALTTTPCRSSVGKRVGSPLGGTTVEND
jgi:hypothetical protein